MKQIRGMWFPDGDTHFEAQLAINPLVDGRGTYQHKKYIAALPYVKGRGHALDIGGHVGLWSRIMAMDFDRVTAFEPLPEHIECFRANLAEKPNVRLNAVAVADKAGELSIRMPADNTGNSHIATAGEAIAARTLDSFRLKGVDFIKIDVEGSEWEILSALGEAFLSRAKYITGELHGHRDFELLALLERHFHVAVRKRLQDRVFMFQAMNRSRT